MITVQIFVYKLLITNFCFELYFFRKRKKNLETFHILKMKTHFEKEQHFENERLWLLSAVGFNHKLAYKPYDLFDCSHWFIYSLKSESCNFNQ